VEAAAVEAGLGAGRLMCCSCEDPIRVRDLAKVKRTPRVADFVAGRPPRKHHFRNASEAADHCRSIGGKP